MTIEAYLAHKTKRSRWGLGAKTGQLIYFYGTAHRPFVHVWHWRPVNTKWYSESGTTQIKYESHAKVRGQKGAGAKSHARVRNGREARAGAWLPHGKKARSRVRDTAREKEKKEKKKSRVALRHAQSEARLTGTHQMRRNMCVPCWHNLSHTPRWPPSGGIKAP